MGVGSGVSVGTDIVAVQVAAFLGIDVGISGIGEGVMKGARATIGAKEKS